MDEDKYNEALKIFKKVKKEVDESVEDLDKQATYISNFFKNIIN